MAYRNTPFVENEYYHLYNRGVEKRVIFLDKQDHEHFLYLMDVCNSKQSILFRDTYKATKKEDRIVAIGAYCLMPNHFHIMIKEITKNGISIFMKKLLTAYSMYFNKKYKRTGHLFEGVFKSKHVNTDKQFRYLYAYIHLNPAKLANPKWRDGQTRNAIELLEYCKKYPYSSLREYLATKLETTGINILEPHEYPDYFTSPKSHLTSLFEWLSIA